MGFTADARPALAGDVLHKRSQRHTAQRVTQGEGGQHSAQHYLPIRAACRTEGMSNRKARRSPSRTANWSTSTAHASSPKQRRQKWSQVVASGQKWSQKAVIARHRDRLSNSEDSAYVLRRLRVRFIERAPGPHQHLQRFDVSSGDGAMDRRFTSLRGRRRRAR